MRTKAQPDNARRFITQWFQHKVVIFTGMIAVVTSLLLTVGTQDDLHDVPFSLRFGVLFFLNLVMLYGVALYSYVRVARERLHSPNSHRGQTR